jgi:hypothetical protein
MVNYWRLKETALPKGVHRTVLWRDRAPERMLSMYRLVVKYHTWLRVASVESWGTPSRILALVAVIHGHGLIFRV